MASCTLQLATTMSPTTRNRLQHALEKSLESIQMALYLLTIHFIALPEPKKRFGRLACAIHSHLHSSLEQTPCTSMMWVIMDGKKSIKVSAAEIMDGPSAKGHVPILTTLSQFTPMSILMAKEEPSRAERFIKITNFQLNT